MNILIACIHYPVASGRYIQRAFQRLGHDVRTVGPSTGADIWGMRVRERWVWTPDFDSASAARDWNPDLTITADSGWCFPHSVARHVVWGVDNHVHNYWPERKFNALFLAHSQGARMGEPNVHWLPCCYDPAAHTDTGGERDYDVGMVGVMYPERQALIDALRAAGLRVLAGTGLLWEDYNAAMNRCKLALVNPVANDLPLRFFENMAQGCCVLAPRLPDAERLGFKAGVNFWPYATAAELVKESQWLLKNGHWQTVATSGQVAVQGHTWDARAQTLLNTLGMNR